MPQHRGGADLAGWAGESRPLVRKAIVVLDVVEEMDHSGFENET